MLNTPERNFRGIFMTSDYGFVYIWFDRKHRRYYIGAHWGYESDSYICSSPWMKQAYKKRPEDFKRRIISSHFPDKMSMFAEEQRIQQYIKDGELGKKYYNLCINKQHWSVNSNAADIAKRSGLARRGSKLGPRSQETKDKISATKKERGQTEAQITAAKANVTIARLSTHTDEAQAKRSASLKQAYADGRHSKRPKKETRPLYAPGEKQRLLWADPVWAANQRQKLKEASARQYAKT